MYLYFNYEGKLQTAIAHGNPIRQGDSFDLYVCFDLDFFKKNSLLNGSELLYMSYKTPSENHFSPFSVPLENKGSIKFVKNSDSEVTYKLKDGQRYITYYANISANSGITNEAGDLQLVFCFQRSAGVEYILDASTGYYHLDANATTENVLNLPAKLYIEATYSKNNPILDGTIDIDDYNTLVNLIGTVSNEKNIILEEMDFFNYGEDPTDDYATLLDRANYIFEKEVPTRVGWVVVGKKNEVTLDEEEQQVATIKNTDLYLILDEENMFVVDCEDGVLYRYNDSELTPLTYNKQFLDNLLNITELGESLRLVEIEGNASYGVEYDNGVFQWLKGKTKVPQQITTIDALRQDMGVVNIEEDATFGVEYTNKTLKAQNGLPSPTNPKTTLFTSESLKTDMNLDLVDNKASTNTIQNNEELVATAKAVFDTLEKAATNQANPNTTAFNNLMKEIAYIKDFFFTDGEPDVDDKVNKLEEVLEILQNIPENYDIYALITNIYNKIGEEFEDTFFYNEDWSSEDKAKYSIKGRITELEQNADSHILEIMRYEDNQELFTLNNWVELQSPNEDYPEATYYATIQINTLVDVVDMEITFDKTIEQSFVIGANYDTETKTITIYALEEPITAITIDTIKLISNLYHATTLSTTALNQIATNTHNIASNTTDIGNLTNSVNDINDNQLPQYVKIGNNQRTFIKVNQPTTNGSQLVLGNSDFDLMATKTTLDASLNVTTLDAKIGCYLDTNDTEVFITACDGNSRGKIILYGDNIEITIGQRVLTFDANGDLKIDNVKVQTNGNLVTTFGETPSDTYYPSEKLVKDSLDAKGSLVTSFQATPDNTHYPSEKLVKDNLDAKGSLVTSFQATPDNTHYPSEKLVKNSLDAKASYSQTTATITNETSITPPKDVLIGGVVKNKVVKIGDLNLVDLDYSCLISNNGWGTTTYYIVVIRINLPIEIDGKYPVTIIVDGVSETQQVQFTSNSTTHTTEGVATKRVDNVGDDENFEFELLMHEILF